MVKCPLCQDRFLNRSSFSLHAVSQHGWDPGQADAEYRRLNKKSGAIKLGYVTILHCPSCRKWWEHHLTPLGFKCQHCGKVRPDP